MMSRASNETFGTKPEDLNIYKRVNRKDRKQRVNEMSVEPKGFKGSFKHKTANSMQVDSQLTSGRKDMNDVSNITDLSGPDMVVKNL